jgi:hypothetical protein
MRTERFTKSKHLKEALKIHRETKKEIDLAYIIARKIESMLPKGWTASFVIGMWRGLCVSFHSSSYDENHKKIQSSALDFKLVCKLVEKATGLEVKKSPWIEGDYFFALKGSVQVPIGEEKDDHSLTISIRHHDPSDCKLTYETKTVRVATVDDDCLGLMENG